MAEKPLSDGTNLLPHSPAEVVFLQETLRGTVGSAAGSADVWDGQQSADEANHPIIAIGDVVKQVEPDLSVQPPGDQICFYLPQVVIELVAALKIQKWPQPRREGYVLEMDTRERVFRQAFFNARTVLCLGHDPKIVMPAYLQQQVPAKHIFAALESRQAGRATGKNTGQDASSRHFRFQEEFTCLAQDPGVEESLHFRDTNKRLHHRPAIFFAIGWT